MINYSDDFEQILTNPILDIAARLWEPNRYSAFKICYRWMRQLDDLVDDRKISGEPISPEEKSRLAEIISNQIKSLRGEQIHETNNGELVGTIKKFKIPLWPWERLCRSMLYDLENNSFGSFPLFLRYCEGAAVAPAAVFVFLCGVTKEGDQYRPPDLDIRRVARPLAVFSYLVHIIRDFQKDQRNHLNYFADTIVSRHKLCTSDLEQIANGGKIGDSFRNLMAQYCAIADYYRKKARLTLDKHQADFKPTYRLSLEIIYQLYLQIFERFNPRTGSFSAAELNLSLDKVKNRLRQTVENADIIL